jgi:O-antigen/teichoic acid export membrane protein
MRRFFVKNILFVLTVNLLVKPIWAFFIDRTVQNTVGDDYGTYLALFNLSIIFSILLDLGITNYNTRTVAQNHDKVTELFPSMLSARVVLMCFYFLISYGWGYLLGYRGWKLYLLIGVLAFQALNALVAFMRSNIAGLQKFKTDSLVSILDKLLMIVICGSLLLWPVTAARFRIQWLVGAQIVSYFISALVGYLIVRRIGKVRLRFSFHPAAIYDVIKQSFPYALLIFQMSIYNRTDAIMIERICPDGARQADVWAAAFRLLDQANMIGLMFATVLLPLFGRMLSQQHDVQPIVKVSVNMMLPLSFIVAVAGVFFSSDIMHLLYKGSHGNTEYDVIFAWLIASFPSWCLMYVYSTLLTANGSMKVLNIIAFAGVVFNLALNFCLIPGKEAVGGAITSFLTQTLLSLAFMVAASRIAALPFNAKWAMALLGYLVFCIALAYGINTYLGSIHWLIRLFSFGGIGVIMMFLFRFISVGSIRQLMNRS